MVAATDIFKIMIDGIYFRGFDSVFVERKGITCARVILADIINLFL